MYQMIEGGMRSGVCMISTRHAKANNKYMGQHYDLALPSINIIYVDANNLSGWAMSRYLPCGKFEWVSQAEWERLDWTFMSAYDPEGYFIECDLEYPVEFLALHNDYPMALSESKSRCRCYADTQAEKSRHYNRARTQRNVKLVPNLMIKVKDTTH